MTRAFALAAAVAMLAGCGKPAAPSAPGNAVAPHPGAPLLGGAVPILDMPPLTAGELEALLRAAHRFSFPDRDLPEITRALEFDGHGRVIDGSCDPAACEGRYTIAGNVMTMRFESRLSTLHFYRSETGRVYAGFDAERFAYPW
jgi:hypothetical protein